MGVEIQDGDSSDSATPISAINVTPFVDVVLVLLVIFMITAPSMMKDTLGIQLPKASSSDGAKPETLAVAINAQGQILVNGTLSSAEELKLTAEAAVKKNPAIQALVAADENSRHGALVLAVDTLKQAGLEKFAVQIQRPASSAEGQAK